MTQRRDFFKSTAVASVGLTALSSPLVGQAKNAETKYSGPHKMPVHAKILSIQNADGSETMGYVTDKGILDVKAAQAHFKMASPIELEELLHEGNADGFQKLVDKALNSGFPLKDESTIKYGRLFKKPGKIVCVGLNYLKHAREVKMTPPSVPPLFNKYNNTLAAHQCTIDLPPKELSYKFDYETELLIVIGKTMRNVPEAQALEYVAGYCTSNDFSARDLQTELPSGQWMIGKTLDKFAPIGPYFVTSDLVGNPNNLKLETRVNGELRQSSNTSDFIFNTQQMISYISKFWTLEPGDIVFTGTPEGVILGKPKDQQVWLKAGDQIVSSIEKLGELKFNLA
jgi:2-keto-4-pentenoate hydratase/2-oxohepta-3-ene-1,7-dioic acid hydratase in catechol pathway